MPRLMLPWAFSDDSSLEGGRERERNGRGCVARKNPVLRDRRPPGCHCARVEPSEMLLPHCVQATPVLNANRPALGGPNPGHYRRE